MSKKQRPPKEHKPIVKTARPEAPAEIMPARCRGCGNMTEPRVISLVSLRDGRLVRRPYCLRCRRGVSPLGSE